MARPSKLKLSLAQRTAILGAADGSADADFRDRCRAILALGSGQSRAQVAGLFKVHEASVGRWARSYRRDGINGVLAPKVERRGRPCKLSTEDLAWLRTTALSLPQAHGFAFTAWSLPRLASYLEQERGVRVRSHYIGHLLRRAGLSRVRPKHTLEGKRDEVAHALAKRRVHKLRKQAKRGDKIVISQDETEIHLFPYLTAVWAVVGSPQRKVATPGKNQKRVLYGGLDLCTGALTTHWAPTKSGTHFIAFLHVLLAAYAGQKIILITDNGSFHHTKATDLFLAAHRDQIEVKWLPAYCPDLNDIERTWRSLKRSHASNFLFNSLDSLVANVQKGIAELDRRIA
jgi:transposase